MQTPGTTYLVLPGPLRRIVSRRAGCPLTLADYRHAPHLWAEAGLISPQGRVVCLDAPPRVLADLRDCEPIRSVLAVHDHDEVAP